MDRAIPWCHLEVYDIQCIAHRVNVRCFLQVFLVLIRSAKAGRFVTPVPMMGALDVLHRTCGRRDLVQCDPEGADVESLDGPIGLIVVPGSLGDGAGFLDQLLVEQEVDFR